MRSHYCHKNDSDVRPSVSRKSRRAAGIRHPQQRRGAITVLSAVLLVVLLGMVAFSIDTGYMYTVQSQLQRSVDAAALAGAGALVDGPDAARATALEYAVRNPVGKQCLVANDDELQQRIAEFQAQYPEDFEIKTGRWDDVARQFVETDQLPSSILVRYARRNEPLFFANVLGYRSFDLEAQAIAKFQPRDIMLVLDLSASMNDDSELSAIGELGRETVLANIHQMWEDLGSPTYGNMGYEPDWVTIPGTSLPAQVKWRTDEVDVAATTRMQYVKLYFSTGRSQTFSTSSTAGTWEGTGSNRGDLITKCKVKINGSWETFDFFDNSDIRRGLGLNSVPYPYPSGSWNDYIEYARSHSSSMPWYDQHVYNAGYRRKFGLLTLINFWNKNKPEHDQTPDLWKVSAQPVTAVKNAVDLFFDYMREVDTDDRVGLSVYNSQSGYATLESGLTGDFDVVENTVRQRQAGHYHNYTNIGAGMQVAREELDNHGRAGAKKMLVLMTDGNANYVNGRVDTRGACEYVLTEARRSADRRYPIMTISLGAGADTSLMEEVAEITDSRDFVIPGGQTVAEYAEELREVFHNIADDRPLAIVQ